MFDCRVIEESIAELENGKPTYELCRNLAALYIIRDKMNRCFEDNDITSESDFIKAVQGKPIANVLATIDDLMHTVRMLSPKTYQITIDSLKNIEAG